MPKERTHWLLARRLTSRLTSGPAADAVLAYPELVLAGAVAPDSAWYRFGEPAAQAAADRLHGNGSFDSYEPFRVLAAHSRTLGAPGLAFGLGALTHLAADVTFHPLIFSWTGDAGAPEPGLRSGWLYRHRACETALDLHLEALWGPAPVRSWAALVRRAGPDLGTVFSTWAGDDARPWIGSQGRIQGLFGSRIAGGAALALSWPDRGGDGDFSALFYRGRPVLHPAFQGTLEWVDPVSGAPCSATLEELAERFETLALDLASCWERAWTAGTVPFEGQTGPALDTGVGCRLPQLKRHFTPKWF